jgi:uncharacterized protein RhaS with RHS repeats
MGARVYDPDTGTFMQPDPVKGGGANAYGYTDGDPVNETDLSGMCLIFSCSTYHAVGHAVSTGVHVVENVAAVAPYAAYYGSYEAGKGINDVGSHLGVPGRIASHVVVAALGLPAVETVGLAGDVAGDAIKGESIRDEGVKGSIDPLHDWLGSGPKTYLPGVHANGKIDFEW